MVPAETDGGLATLSVLRAADRALALAGGDADVIGASINTADQTRKLTFLKAGPEKEIYNQHGLQTPVSAYQLMAGTVIAASLITGLNSDLPGFVIAQVPEWTPCRVCVLSSACCCLSRPATTCPTCSARSTP
jgi:type IV secretion system protein VirB10